MEGENSAEAVGSTAAEELQFSDVEAVLAEDLAERNDEDVAKECAGLHI